MVEVSDCEVIAAMLRYGGHFVKALAAAAQVADRDNRMRIKRTWPEYWREYSMMSRRNSEKVKKLADAHGTPEEFEKAVHKAWLYGNVSSDEADAAIAAYNKEWESAARG